jgi:cell volume regulation protein A
VSVHDVIQTLSLILACGLVARLIGDLVHVPEIVLMVGLGVAVGPSGLDVIDIPLDSVGASMILTVGVAFILFYGGLGLSLPLLRTVSVGLAMLVVPGVMITAAITGTAAGIAFGLPVDAALLIGAVLAPTDPAILIPLFARTRVSAKLAQTVIAESAFNDPTGAILALAVAGVVRTGDVSITAEVADFARNLLFSTVLGVIIGFALALAICSKRSGIWRESPAIAVLLAVSAGYFSLESVDGSGYLGAFIAGLIVGNMRSFGLEMNPRHQREMYVFSANVADIVTMLVFLTLGANLPLSQMWDNLATTLAVLAVFLLVARPVAVFTCTLPDRRGGWTRREQLFLCWTRETGVVPAAVAGLLVANHTPHAQLIVSIVATAIVVTLLLQATTAGALARRLQLTKSAKGSNASGAAGHLPAPT